MTSLSLWATRAAASLPSTVMKGFIWRTRLNPGRDLLAVLWSNGPLGWGLAAVRRPAGLGGRGVDLALGSRFGPLKPALGLFSAHRAAFRPDDHGRPVLPVGSSGCWSRRQLVATANIALLVGRL